MRFGEAASMIESSRTNKGTTDSALVQADINAGLSCTRRSQVNTTTATLTPLLAMRLLRSSSPEWMQDKKAEATSSRSFVEGTGGLHP